MSSTNNDSEDDDPRVHSSGMSSSSQPSRRYELSKSELRKNNKPIMEKKRRARINQCLNELKTLILDALKKDPARHTKLEKADILEMTVRHLQSLHRSSGNNRSMGAAGVGAGLSVEPSSSSAALTAAVVQKFQTGYQECAGEVNRFVGRLDGVDVDIKKRLMSHLDACVAKMRYVAAAAAGNAPPPNMNDYTLHHQLDSPSIAAGSSALEPSTALVPGGSLLPLLRVGVQPSVPLKSSVDHHLRASAFTAVCGSSPSNVERPTFVYCDEPADVSSTSSWAEDAAASAITVCKNPPLDFSIKKSVTACVSHNKKPLGDISVNVPTLTATTASSSSHKTNNAMTASSGDNGPTGPAQRLSVAAVAAEPCNDPGPDPNMWRPW